MTPEEKAKEWACWGEGNACEIQELTKSALSDFIYHAYLAGHAEGIKWCVERLRSKEAQEGSMRADTNPDEQTTQLYGPAWADWLESQAQE